MAMLWQQRGAGSVIMALWYGLASDGGDIVCMYICIADGFCSHIISINKLYCHLM